MNTAFKLLTDIIKNVIFGSKTAPDKNAVIENLNGIYELAAAQDLAHIVGYYIEKNGFSLDGEPAQTLVKYKYSAIFRDERLTYTTGKTAELFRNHNIRFINLKGDVIKNLYPQTWLRTRCDSDILIDRENLEKAAELLEKEMGFTVTTRTDHDISLYSRSGVHIELHYTLIEDGELEKTDKILDKIWEYTENDGCEYKLTDEAFYLYNIAHTAKHVKGGGCGIRPFIDLLLLKKNNLDNGSLLETAGLSEFERSCTKLANVWFCGESHNETTKLLENYILSGNLYGSLENRIAVSHTKHGGKTGVILSRIFMPYKTLCKKYPELEKHPYLAPAYQLKRWVSCLTEGRIKARMNEAIITTEMSAEKSADTVKLFKILGI